MKYIIIIVVVILIVALVLRYGIFYPSKCDHRKNAFFVEGYLRNLVKQKQEPGFTVRHIINKSNTRNIISYCIYGTNPKYFRNIVKNIMVAKTHLPEWQIRVYVHDKVSQEFVNKLVENGAEVCIVHDPICAPGNGAGTFWRFLPLVEDVNVVILDADEKLSNSDVKDIKHFFTNDTNLVFGMSVTPFSKSHLTACKLYKKKEFKLPYSKDFIEHYPVRSPWGSDEIFLTCEVSPHAKKQGLTKKKLFFEFLLRDNEPESIYPIFLSRKINGLISLPNYQLDQRHVESYFPTTNDLHFHNDTRQSKEK